MFLILSLLLFVVCITIYTKQLKSAHKNAPTEPDVDKIFEGFVGNRPAVFQLKRILKYARINNINRLPNIGLFGSKSTGKTELFRRIGEALRVPTLVLSKSTLSTEENFFKEVAKEIDDFSGGMLTPEPMLIFIDEVHVLPRRIQDSLLTALESDDRCFRSKHGDINTKNITFVVATTDPGKLSEAFLSRLLIVNLEPYTEQEIVNILKYRRARDPQIDRNAQTIDDQSLKLIAKASRLTPRKSIEVLKQIAIAISLQEVNPNYDSILVDLNMTLGVDHNGLTKTDKKYLKFLKENGQIGLSSIAAYLDTDPNNIKEIVEPYLIRLGLIRFNRSGRFLTSLGRKFLDSYV